METLQYLLRQREGIGTDNGLSMPGYFVWGGSVIESDGMYWMFASRWPKDSSLGGDNILDGYRTSSEIVLASSTVPEGPYTDESVVIGKREDRFWDSKMAHNPYLIGLNGLYVLFYIGSKVGDKRRKVGYAVSETVQGPYLRADQEIALTDDANNPAPFETAGGQVGLVFRDRDLHVFTAIADRYDSPFCIVAEDIFQTARLEDFCVYRWDGNYHMICEDNRGEATGHWRWGAHFESADGLRDWRRSEPIIAYDHTTTLADGGLITFDRRERPQLLFDTNRNVTHLVTSALKDGESRCLVVPVTL